MSYGTGLAVDLEGKMTRFSLSGGGMRKVAALQKSAKVVSEFNAQSVCRGERERILLVLSAPIILEPGSGIEAWGEATINCTLVETSPIWSLTFHREEKEVLLNCTPFEIWIEDPDYPQLF